MENENIRMECLRLATPGASISPAPHDTAAIVERARAYADFVLDANNPNVTDPGPSN